MGHFDEFFGGFFNFNNDSNTSLDEELLGIVILEDVDNSTIGLDMDDFEDLFDQDL